MAKVRITTWAKKNGKSSVEIVKELGKKGFKVRNQTSLIEEAVLETNFPIGETNEIKKKAEEKKPVEKEVILDKKSVVEAEIKSSEKSETKPARETTNSESNSKQHAGSGYNNKNGQTGGNRYNNNNGQTGGNRYNNNNGQTGGNRYNNNNGQTGGNRYNNNNGQTGGNRYNNNNGQTGGNRFGDNKRPYNANSKPYNNVKKQEEELPQTEAKKTNQKKNKQNSQKKKTQFDRFRMFDKKERVATANDKTKTQLKKEERERRKEELSKKEKIIKWTDDMTVGKFAQEMDIPATDIIGKLFELGIMSTMNQILDKGHAEIIGIDYNVSIIEDDTNNDLEFEQLLPKYSDEDLVQRPPVVTIMGHVDHGKTTLLDSLRDENVAEKEAGGITQHIGAYQIEKDGFKVTFLDTPGHEAFTAMRARGANITDIVIIVVAANDGVMPQTKEAVAHALESKNPIIVAVNKMDLPEANPQRVMSELAELGIQSEEWGGEVPFVEISAKTKMGLDNLLDYIKVITDINEFKAPDNVNGYGTVIEAHLDKGRGAVATVLVQGGRLRASDSIVIGDTWGTIRVMQDEYNKRHKEVRASMPVEITGLKNVPQAGDMFVVCDDSKEAQSVGEKRAALKETKDRSRAHAMTLDELNQKISQGDISELPILIKADVQGSVEALAASLEKIEVGGVKVRIIHRGVGAINESDVMLAQAGNGIIIGFNVRPDANSRRLIEKEKIELLLESVIYKIIEQIEDSMNGMRKKEVKETIVGYAKVQEVFKITGVGKIAGAICTEGKIVREGKLRLVRDGIVLYDGEIGQLKRYKDDAKEIIESQECGISFKNYEDIKKGDELECYTEYEQFVQYDN